MKKVKSWSYSAYSLHKKCPKQYFFKKIAKLPEPPSPALERGNAIHKKAEDYVLQSKGRVPKELSIFREEFKMVRRRKLAFAVEQNWAFTKDFVAQTNWDNWTGAWCRVKIDLVLNDPKEQDLFTVIDHKTGKVYEQDHKEQLELSALATFLWTPQAKKVKAENWYLDQGPEYSTTYDYEVKQVPSLKKKWIAKVKPMFNDTSFPERPGAHCMWCPFSKRRGGQCKFGG